MMQTLHLIDASLYVFRAWHSMPPQFSDRDGAPVNAVHGFTRFLCDFLERAKPTHVLAAFDESLTSSFRNNIYPAYKANRELPPAELLVQFSYCKRIAAALGMTVLSDQYYEADDLIGSAVVRVRGEGFRTVIVSADKDFGQMVGADDELWDFSKNERWDAAGVKRRLGVRPDQVADFLALTGDAVDNIPGVPGIGPKTAAVLMRTFESLDDLYARLDVVNDLPLRGAASVAARLAQHREAAYLARQLTGIHCAMPLTTGRHDLRRRSPDCDRFDRFCDAQGFGLLLRRQVQRLGVGAGL